MSTATDFGKLLIAATVLLATACEQQAEPAPTAAAPPVPASIAPVPATAPVAALPSAENSPIWFVPASVSECAQGETAVVHWNASKFPGVTVVKVSMVLADGSESLFATTTAENSKETGPWARGGLEVVLRDDATNDELARVKIPGTPCQ